MAVLTPRELRADLPFSPLSQEAPEHPGLIPDQARQHAIARAVHQAIATHAGRGGHLCALYAAVGSLVVGELLGKNCLPVVGGLILQGRGNTLHHWLPSSPDFGTLGHYHCWIELQSDCPKRPGVVHIDFSTRHDDRYGGRRPYIRRVRQSHIWGWADEVRISLDEFARLGQVPAGRTLVLKSFSGTEEWMFDYLNRNTRALTKIAGAALADLSR